MEFQTGKTPRDYRVGGSFKITESGFYVEVIVYDPLWREVFYATVSDYDDLYRLLKEELVDLAADGKLINLTDKGVSGLIEEILITLEVMTRRD